MNNPQVMVGDRAAEHPAFRAWARLHGSKAAPAKIEVLRHGHRKRMVYRLSGLGIAGEDVIAKRSFKQYVGVERAIYEDILPDLPLSSLRYYGSTEDNDPNYGWLFIEDADGHPYTPRLRAHRIAAGHWLGVLHTSSASHIDALSQLPDRGPGHYLERLRSARRSIERSLGLDLEFESGDLDPLRMIVSNFDGLERQWDQLQGFCDRLPRTLVHGDFSEKNIRVRAAEVSTGVPTLVSFDWGEAGRGIPPVDILGRFGQGGSHSSEPDTYAYWLVARRLWRLPIETIRRFETVGKAFRAIAAIDWDLPSDGARIAGEPSPTGAYWIGNFLRLRHYGLWLRECLEELRRF